MNIDGEIKIHEFKDKNKVLVYLDENEFRKKVRFLKVYQMKSYKYFIFEVVKKLKSEGKNNGRYELDLNTDKLFRKVYGKIRLLFSVKEDVVLLEDIVADDKTILNDGYSKELGIYKGVPYRDAKDLFKIKMMERRC